MPMEMEEDDEDLEQLRRAALRTMKPHPMCTYTKGAVFRPHPLNSNLISIIPCTEEPLQEKSDVPSKFSRFDDSKKDYREDGDSSFDDLLLQLQQVVDEHDKCTNMDELNLDHQEEPIPKMHKIINKNGHDKELTESSINSSSKSPIVCNVVSTSISQSKSPDEPCPRSRYRISRSPYLYRNISPPLLSKASISRYSEDRDTLSRSPITPPRKQQPLSRVSCPRFSLHQSSKRHLLHRHKYRAHSPIKVSSSRKLSPHLNGILFHERKIRSPSPWSPSQSNIDSSLPQSGSFSSISSSSFSSIPDVIENMTAMEHIDDDENEDSNFHSFLNKYKSSKKSLRTLSTDSEDEDDVLDLGLEKSIGFSSEDELNDDVMKTPKVQSSSSVTMISSPSKKWSRQHPLYQKKRLKSVAPNLDNYQDNVSQLSKLRGVSVRTLNKPAVDDEPTQITRKVLSRKRDSELETKEDRLEIPSTADTVRKSSLKAETKSRKCHEIKSIVCEMVNSSEVEDGELIDAKEMDLRAKLSRKRKKKSKTEKLSSSSNLRILKAAIDDIFIGVKSKENGKKFKKIHNSHNEWGSQRRVFFLGSESDHQNTPSFNVTIPKGNKYEPKSPHEVHRERRIQFAQYKYEGTGRAW